MKKIINIKMLVLIFLLLLLPLFVGCVSITPTPTNQSPTITSTPITTATVDVLYNYNVVSTDPDDGDTLTCSLTTSPTGMTINSATGVINWTPSTEGDYDVTVEVSDGELFDTQSFIITVNPPCDADEPTVVTNDVSNEEKTTATANGNITSTGGEDCTVRGFQYGKSETPTWDVHSSGSFGTGSFSEGLSGLDCETTYYVRAYATNCAGTDYGAWKSFTTADCVPCVADQPTVVTNDASGIGTTTATANGNITATGGENCTVRGFQYGLSPTPTWNEHSSGSFGTGSYSEGLSGLTCKTTYYVRAYATNCAGTDYGDWKSFTTADCPNPPTVVTNDASGIGTTTATANGNITDTGGEDCTVRGFQYGLCPTPTGHVEQIVGGPFGTGSYSAGLTGLTPDTEYCVRAYAINSAGIGYGDWKSFPTDPITPNLKLTPCPQTVTLGNQVTINIVVEDVTDLRGASITLNFESPLQYSSSSKGGFIPNATLMDSSTSSSVTLDIAGLGTSGYHSGMGTGTIITVKFDTVATASPTNITFGSTTLRDKDNITITHTKSSGCSVTIN
jgi:hypothetical protein